MREQVRNYSTSTSPHVRVSGIQENFVYGIRNPELWNPE